MTQDQLVAQTADNFKAGNSKYPQLFVIDDFLYIVVVAAISGAISWMVQRCLNHEFSAEKVRRLVRWSCRGAVQEHPGVITAEELDSLHGDRMSEAIKTTYDQLGPDGLSQVRETHNVYLGLPPEMPEGA